MVLDLYPQGMAVVTAEAVLEPHANHWSVLDPATSPQLLYEQHPHALLGWSLKAPFSVLSPSDRAQALLK